MDHDFIVSGSFTPYGIDSLEQCALTGNGFVAHATCAVHGDLLSVKMLSDLWRHAFVFVSLFSLENIKQIWS